MILSISNMNHPIYYWSFVYTKLNVLYNILRVYKYTREHYQLIMTTSITNEYTSLYKSLTLYFRKGDVCCVWEMSGDKYGLLYWPKFFLAHSILAWVAQPGVTKGPKPCLELVLTLASCLQLTRTTWAPGYIIF